MRHSRRPGAKWFPYRAVRRYCPHCGVELRLVPRPCGHVLHLLMGAGIIGYLLFFLSHPSIMLRIGLWALEGGLLLIMLPLTAALFKWLFRVLCGPG